MFAASATDVNYEMSVQVYGCNHVAIEVDDIKKAIAFYKDVFNLEKMDSGEPFLVWKRYTLSLGDKATLRAHLEAWRGRKFTADELESAVRGQQ